MTYRFIVDTITPREVERFPAGLTSCISAFMDPTYLCTDALSFATTVRGARGRLMGAHFYSLSLLSDGFALDSTLTVVLPAARKQGLAENLWRHTLRAHAIKRVKVICVTKKGLSLMRRVKRAHPTITFRIKDSSAMYAD